MHKLSYLVYADRILLGQAHIVSLFYKLFNHLFLELTNIPAAYWSENKESIEKLESWGKKPKHFQCQYRI